jgi:hypothetical protein
MWRVSQKNVFGEASMVWVDVLLLAKAAAHLRKIGNTHLVRVGKEDKVTS